MPVSTIYSSPNDFWIQDGAIRFELNALDDPDKLAVSLAAGAVIMAWKQGVIDYNAGLNYRTWALGASPTHFDRHEKVYVYVRLSKVGDTAQLVYPYEKIPLDPALYADESDESDAPGYDLNYYYILLGALTPSEINGQTVNREWSSAEGEVFSTGVLDTDQYRREQPSDALKKMFNLVNNVIHVLLPFDKLWFSKSGENKYVDSIITTTGDTIQNFSEWADAHGLATTASIASYISAHLKTLDDKFFRKDIPDTSPHLATFGSVKIEKGLPVPSEGGEIPSTGTLAVEGNATFGKNIVAEGKVITDFIQSTSDLETLDTLFGEGFLMKILNGKAHLFTDFLTVRMKAIFAELEIRKLSYVGGSIALTPSGGQVAHVVEMKEGNVVVGYKCYMTADDGSMATTNSFAVGDQARCQTFNLEGAGKYTDVSNKYYWRLVVEAGQERVDESFHVLNERDEGYEEAKVTNYVVLSNRVSETMDGLPYKGYDDSAENDVPAQGDTIVGMGNQKSPTKRGNIIMLRTVDESGGDNAPSATLYRGVGASPNPYSLIGKDILHFSPSDGFTVLADFFQIRSNPTTPPTPINQYVGIHLIECSTLLVSTNTINAAEPTVLGGQMVSTLYAVQLGEYLLKMGEESEGSTAVIKCRAALQSYNERTYITGTLVAKNMRGTEEVSTIDTSTSGELQFTYSQIDPTCDCVKIALSVDGEEKAVANIGIVKDGKPGDKGADAEFDTLEDLGSSARIYFADTYNDGTLVSTTMKLNVDVTAIVKHIVGGSSTPVSDLTDYALEASYSYNNLVHTIDIPKQSGTFYYNNANKDSGQQGYIGIDPSLLGSLSKTLWLTLIKNQEDVQTIDIPITLDENQNYIRTKKMMESLYTSGGDVSIIRQIANSVSAKVAKLGSQFLPTGWDVEHLKMIFTANDVEFQNNAGSKTAWMDELGNFTTRGIQSQLRQVVDDAESFLNVFTPATGTDYEDATDTDEGADTKTVTAEAISIGTDSEHFVPALAVAPLSNESAYVPRYDSQPSIAFISLDMRSAEGLVDIQFVPTFFSPKGASPLTLPIYIIQLPFLCVTGIEDSEWGAEFVRTPTRMNGVELHYITLEELKSLVGRRAVIVNSTDCFIFIANIKSSTILLHQGDAAVFEFGAYPSATRRIEGRGQSYTDGSTPMSFDVSYPQYFWKHIQTDAYYDIRSENLDTENFGINTSIVIPNQSNN